MHRLQLAGSNGRSTGFSFRTISLLIVMAVAAGLYVRRRTADWRRRWVPVDALVDEFNHTIVAAAEGAIEPLDAARTKGVLRRAYVPPTARLVARWRGRTLDLDTLADVAWMWTYCDDWSSWHGADNIDVYLAGAGPAILIRSTAPRNVSTRPQPRPK